MRAVLWLLLCSVIALTACGVPPSIIVAGNSSVIPSPTGVPNSVTVLGNLEFVSVQTAGQIFTYNFSTGTQVQIGAPYATPCNSPSGIAIVAEGNKNIMAVACYDAHLLLTLNVAADGSLTSLGSVALAGVPYPEIATDGTNVFIPLFTQTGMTNGGVVKVDISNPSVPVVTGTATLVSPFAGAVADGSALTVAGGYIYVASGSETAPLTGSSSVQVFNETTMALVGSPLVVPHSPQRIVVSGSTAYMTIYDAEEVDSIDVSNPASLKQLQVFAPASPAACHALGLAVRDTTAYLGCYAEGNVDRIDVSAPAAMTQTNYLSGMGSPQSITFSGSWMFVVSSAVRGSVYMVYVGPSN